MFHHSRTYRGPQAGQATRIGEGTFRSKTTHQKGDRNCSRWRTPLKLLQTRRQHRTRHETRRKRGTSEMPSRGARPGRLTNSVSESPELTAFPVSVLTRFMSEPMLRRRDVARRCAGHENRRAGGPLAASGLDGQRGHHADESKRYGEPTALGQLESFRHDRLRLMIDSRVGGPDVYSAKSSAPPASVILPRSEEVDKSARVLWLVSDLMEAQLPPSYHPRSCSRRCRIGLKPIGTLGS